MHPLERGPVWELQRNVTFSRSVYALADDAALSILSSVSRTGPVLRCECGPFVVRCTYDEIRYSRTADYNLLCREVSDSVLCTGVVTAGRVQPRREFPTVRGN